MEQPRLEWEGFKLNGKIFKEVEVANLCRDFGRAQVFFACIDLELIPTPQNIQTIRNKCQEWEDNLL